MWIFWALISALMAAMRRPFEKGVIGELHYFTYGFLVQCISLPILAVLVVVTGKLLNPMHLGLHFWLPLAVVSVVFPVLNTYLYKLAIHKGDLSNVLPLQSLGPVFSLLLAWLILDERPNTLAAMGIAITVIGVYALGLKGKRLHHPLRPFRAESSSRAMLALTALISTVAIVEKIAVKVSNPLFYSLASSLGALLTLSIAMRLSKQPTFGNFRYYRKQLSVIGSLQGITYVSYLLAIAAGPIAYVSALRSTNILIGSVFGFLIFKECITKAKLTSYGLIIFGAICITFGS
jgi:uncharacterized membrane protein